MSLGDFPVAAILDKKFTTRAFATGVPTTLAGSPAISVYKDNSLTQVTTGVTLTVDLDGVTGLHNVRVDTSDAFYIAGSCFALVITAGTVGGVSVVGEVIGEFTIEKTSVLRPTVAGRTLDVSAGGEAGLDWANIGSPTTAQNLSSTNIDTDQAVVLTSGGVDAILDDTIGDGTITMRQALRVLIAGMAGKLSGAATTTVTIRNLADSANVIVATVDVDGNRSAVTVTP